MVESGRKHTHRGRGSEPMTGSLESAGALAVGLLFCVSTVPCRYAHFRRSFLSVKWSTVGCFTLISSPNHSVTTHWKTSEDENISDRRQPVCKQMLKSSKVDLSPQLQLHQVTSWQSRIWPPLFCNISSLFCFVF